MPMESKICVWAVILIQFLFAIPTFGGEMIRLEDVQRDRLTKPYLGTYASESDVDGDQILSVHRVGSTLRMAVVANGHKQTLLIFPLHLLGAPESRSFKQGLSRGAVRRELRADDPSSIEYIETTTLGSAKTVDTQRLTLKDGRLTAVRKRIVYRAVWGWRGREWAEDSTSFLGVRNRLDIAFNDLVRLSDRPLTPEELGRLDDAARAWYKTAARKATCAELLQNDNGAE
jgi:hypothetical protein